MLFRSMATNLPFTVLLPVVGEIFVHAKVRFVSERKKKLELTARSPNLLAPGGGVCAGAFVGTREAGAGTFRTGAGGAPMPPPPPPPRPPCALNAPTANPKAKRAKLNLSFMPPMMPLKPRRRNPIFHDDGMKPLRAPFRIPGCGFGTLQQIMLEIGRAHV